MIDYRVAIPSYCRTEALSTRTLPLLADRGIDPERITVFVADEAERDAYKAALDPATYHDLVVGVVGVGPQRNLIERYYPAGTPVFSIDDDLNDLRERVDEKRTIPLVDLDGFIREAFVTTRSLGLRLWGVYPVPNPYFMRQRVTTDLRYIAAGAFGFWSAHDDRVLVDLEDKEDFERSVLYYLADGGVVRFDYICMGTAGYHGAGGMQVTRTPERVDWSARELVRRYPDLCSLNTTKKSGWTEVRLKDRRRRV